MYPIYFSASLKTSEGELLEIGQACISETENSVDFTSEFVPLMKLGSTARIVRTLGNKELEAFEGQVYLSSRKLLQIVGVPDAAMEAARRLFSVNENINCDLYVPPRPTPHINPQKATKISGAIRYVSRDVVKINAMEFIGENDYILFSAEAPGLVLDRMVVQVKERVLLMRNAAILICAIVAPSPENRAALDAYLTRKQNKAEH